MNAAEKGKRLYGMYLDDEDRAKVEEMSEADQTYFWARIYYEMPRLLGKSMLADMEREVLEGNSVKRFITRGLVKEARSLDDLWEPTKPHSWFKASR